MKKSDFWDLKIGFGLLGGIKFEGLLKQYLPEKFEALKLPLRISTFDLKKGKTMTHHQGDLISVVRASCCFPLLFHPVDIQGRKHIDGGMSDWAALKAISKSDRALIHLLEPTGFMKEAMSKSIRSQVKSKSHRILTLDEHLPMGPNRMHLAQEAIEKSYRQTLRRLDEPFR